MNVPGKNKFQSQNGLILVQTYTPRVLFVREIVSIPKWSDFSQTQQMKENSLAMFQSQNGLILVKCRAMSLIDWATFQSQNGLILVIRRVVAVAEYVRFNPKMV